MPGAGTVTFGNRDPGRSGPKPRPGDASPAEDEPTARKGKRGAKARTPRDP